MSQVYSGVSYLAVKTASFILDLYELYPMLNSIVFQIDLDSSGTIDFEEFVKIMC